MSLSGSSAQDFLAALETVTSEHARVVSRMDGPGWAQLSELLTRARQIHVAGKGRSLLVGSMAAMRWMHLGLPVHVLGEPTAPAVGPGDLLVAISGSGTTPSVVRSAEVSLAAGAKVAAITTAQDSPLSEISHLTLFIDAPEKHEPGAQQSAQYAGSLFEQSVLLAMESLFHAMWKTSGYSAELLLRRHSDLG